MRRRGTLICAHPADHGGEPGKVSDDIDAGVVVDVLVPAEVVGGAVGGSEAEVVDHLAKAGPGFHGEQVEPAVPEGEGPTKGGKSDGAREVGPVLGIVDEAGEVVYADADVEPDRRVHPPAALGAKPGLRFADAQVAGHRLLEGQSYAVQNAHGVPAFPVPFLSTAPAAAWQGGKGLRDLGPPHCEYYGSSRPGPPWSAKRLCPCLQPGLGSADLSP